MYPIYQFNDIIFGTLKKKSEDVIQQLSRGDFRSAEVKKMPNTGYYRAKIDYENRLLFQIARYNNKVCIILLEVILNHNYAGSRFLKGAAVDETKLIPVPGIDNVNHQDIKELLYLNERKKEIHYLDKFISFDDEQESTYLHKLPQIIIGSAGSGKTVLTLEKLKTLKGKLLYVTLSQFLAEHSSHLYYSSDYENKEQEIDFMSFREFIESIRIPEGREFDSRLFEMWFQRYRQATGLKDAHKTFEEFRGVLTGMHIEKEYLTKEDYLGLGIKQSIFLNEEKETVYLLFQKYLSYIKENNYYDINIISHRWKELVKPEYDAVIVDEVQDITNIQLSLILQSVKSKENFILCGDSNQVVHPNFFSWSHVKTLFYHDDLKSDIIRIHHNNFRNSRNVSEIANKLLKIKNIRFGSIDRESNYLVETISDTAGEIQLLSSKSKAVDDLNKKTSRSTRYAVIVLRNDNKQKAKSVFNSPLIFSVQESKGLEYENIILYNLLSDNQKEFSVITDEINPGDLAMEALDYNRARDKSDKTADVYKFYINSIYVAFTRAVKNIFIVEENTGHSMFHLLELTENKNIQPIKEAVSTSEEWQKEARRLEMQGKTEQAEQIRKSLLKQEAVPWEPITTEVYEQLKKDALNPEIYNNQAKNRLFDFSIIHNLVLNFRKLSELKYRRADNFKSERDALFRKQYQNYYNDNIKAVLPNLQKYGIDYRDPFNMTPLHIAAYSGAVQITGLLLQNGADTEAIDTFGKTPLQLALSHAYASPTFAQTRLGNIYHLIAPDSIKVKVHDKLIKLNKSHIEYLMLNYFIAAQAAVFQQREYFEAMGIKAADIMESFTSMPSNIVPDYRKKREYISACLSRNEINSTSPYARYLFVRIRTGYYQLNSELEIFRNDKWTPINDIIKFDDKDKEEIITYSIEKRNKLLEEEKKRTEKLIESYKRRRERGYEPDSEW